MKNILVLTSIYPGEGVPVTFTPVVHYFTKEWVKMGYNVHVIHNCTFFPSIFYKAPSFVRKMAMARFGCALPEGRLNEDIDYVKDGVAVSRLPMKKLMPGSPFSIKCYERQVDKIKEKLNEIGFVPDLVISHWANPQLYLSAKLKEAYNIPTALILHDSGAIIQNMPEAERIEKSVDVWGYRSLNIKHDFEDLFGKKKCSFRCFSGIPQNYLDETPSRKWENVNSYIYVGLLIQRKYPDVVIDALCDNYVDENFNLNIVGNGELLSQLQAQVETLNKKKEIAFLGRQPREEVKKLMDKADVFVMISRDEVFGLVYIEAMARGCIVIAARNEGMTGIIEDGKNGFFCNAGDREELAAVIARIKSLSPAQRSEISNNAVCTAQQYTDKAVASDYINNVINLSMQ